MPRSTGSFARKNRLTHPVEFRKVFRSPSRSEDENFLIIASSNGLGCPRLGLAISRKKVRSAVCRNRLKRLLRESFRHNKEQLGGLDIVVTATGKHTRINNRSLAESINKHWKKLVICGGLQSE